MIPPCMMQINAPKFAALSEENLRPRRIPAHRANHWVLTKPGQNGKPWACGRAVTHGDWVLLYP